MEIEVIKDTKLELEMIIHGENHSICNVLRKYLMEDDDVEYAVYGIDHPLTGEPIMTIRTKRTKRPKDSLLRAAQRLKEETAEFKELIDAINVSEEVPKDKKSSSKAMKRVSNNEG